MKRIVSVSLGSSSGDKRCEAEYLGERFSIERVGTNGDLQAAVSMISDLRGQVDVIGLGGIDLYVVAAGRRYTIRDALKMARAAGDTPTVDGSGLKATWEPQVVRDIVAGGDLHPSLATRSIRDLKVLLPTAVDRFGVAEAFAEMGADAVFGDLIFALGIPIKVVRLSHISVLARVLMPVISRLPFSMIYPTGSKQDTTVPKHAGLFGWADVIAGDKHYIRRFMPAAEGGRLPLSGKTLLTNTVRRSDLDEFRQRGLSRLITTTPLLDGETLGTNAMQGVIVCLLGKHPDEITRDEYVETARRIGWKPWIVDLTE